VSDEAPRIEDSRDKKRASLALEIPVEPQASPLNILILQHPQEPDKELGSAALLVRTVENSRLRVGLSWSSLSKAVGMEAKPSEWAVLYLGAKGKDFPSVVNFVNKKIELTAPPEKLVGIVVLDGTWSQAKALWWRNSWLLKLKRIVLQPNQPSRYGVLRREPRREAVSTLESVALAIGALGDPALQAKLEDAFQRMLDEYRKRKKGSSPRPSRP
jgi:DTW domain-containing protein YfiP